MFRRILTGFLAVSAITVMTSAVATAQPPQMAGSKVFIASMDGFDKYFRAATKGVEFPLVFVKTRAEAVYEVTGSTKEMSPRAEALNGVHQTSKHNTTINVSNIASGEIVYTHSITTTVNWPNAAKLDQAPRNSTPSRILAIGRDTAARQCAHALRNAINMKSTI